MTNRQRIWIGGLMVALIAGVVLVATAAWAQTVDIPIETIYRGDPGEVFPVATVPAEPGVECTAILEGRNNESVHPDSDILVGPVMFGDVEDGAFTSAGLSFTASGPIQVAVRLGGDGVFSAGFLLEVTCNPPTTTTTTAVPSPSTTFPSTTVSPTTTTTGSTATTSTLSPPPSGPVEAGGGGCADGSCDHPDSPLARYGGNLLKLGAVALVAALVAAATNAWGKEQR